MSSSSSPLAAFSVLPMTANSVMLTYLDRDKFDLNPPYQRDSGIWNPEKQQLLIDSIINRFDIPKFYFHEDTTTPRNKRKLAVIDGKQRLEAIWGFIDNSFALSADTVYMRDPAIDLAGLTYGELSREHPRIRAEFDNYALSIMVVTTDEPDLIEDMFTRLNEAVPLSAAEKRNALGGPIPDIIRELAKDDFFVRCLPFTNRRYRHYDLACKFLLLADNDGFVDTKKTRLDQFVLDFKQPSKEKTSSKLRKETSSVISRMASEFADQDELLKNVGLITPYFVIFLRALRAGTAAKLRRSKLKQFMNERKENAEAAAKDLSTADYDLLRFDEYAATSVNDRISILFKARVICDRVFPWLQDAFSERV